MSSKVNKCNTSENSLVLYTVCALMGLAVGLAFQRARIMENTMIIGQMTFSHFVMIKMFLTACGTTMIGFALLEKMGVETSRSKNTIEFPRGVTAVALGSSILGAAMGIIGACPGAVFSQLGNGSLLAVFIFLGGLTGSYIFSQFTEYLTKNNQDYILTEPKLSPQSSSMSKLLNMDDHTTAFIFGGCMYSIVFMLEMLVDWRSDLMSVVDKPTWANACPPSLAGLIIGSSNICLQMFLQKTLGCSSSFAYVLGSCMQTNNTYLCRMKSNFQWQAVMMVFIVIGSYISSIMTDGVYVGLPITTWNIVKGFFAGIMLVFGGQLAAGCTSGHGLSGAGFLSTYSFIAIGGMFSFAILFGNLFHLLGL